MEGEVRGIRFTSAANLHVTQFFMGDVPQELLHDMVKPAQEVCSDVPPFCLTAADFHYVPARHPSMIWLRFRKSDGFTEVHRRFTQALSPYLPEPERFTDPVPHVTIARLQRSFRKEHFVLPGITWSPVQDVYALELWETVRTGTGVSYRTLTRWELQGEKGKDVRDPVQQPPP